MYDPHKVTTLDYLIEDIETKINNPNYDKSYLIRLKDFLENNIKKEYENIPVVAITFLVKKYNKNETSEMSEENQDYYKNKEFANLFEKMLRSKTKSKIYSLVSIEDYSEYNILIIGEPDGLSFEGKMNNKAKIYEVKSFNLTKFNQYVKESKEYFLIKKVFNKIKISSSQLMLYQYLLEKTQTYSLIGKKDKINLYGKIYFYSECMEHLNWARKRIEYNFNTIKGYAIKYNAYNLSLKDEEIINMNNKNIYYFKINFRIKYNQKIVENYLKNINELIKSLK
jgi:hypothetical protein